MSARSWIYDRLTGACIDPEEANRYLDAYAHELAEGIRDFAARRIQIDSDDETYGMHMASDLIDPEAKP